MFEILLVRVGVALVFAGGRVAFEVNQIARGSERAKRSP
jgi:hypothetical protein